MHILLIKVPIAQGRPRQLHLDSSALAAAHFLFGINRERIVAGLGAKGEGRWRLSRQLSATAGRSLGGPGFFDGYFKVLIFLYDGFYLVVYNAVEIVLPVWYHSKDDMCRISFRLTLFLM